MKICLHSGSRADQGFLAWPRHLMDNDPFFRIVLEIGEADCVLLVGDRWDVLTAALAAHLLRIPIAHVAGGDVTEGSYDDAMRDCISRLATIHFVTNDKAMARLLAAGYAHVHLVGSPGIDYIKYGDWLKERPFAEPYVVVSYQPETIDDTVDLAAVEEAIAGRKAIWIKPNLDRGSERIPATADYPHDEFLNLLAHCDEFIGNSSAIFYEAPELGIKTTLIGKRQRGRVRPWGDGHASERILKILKEYACALLS